jgi:hypothetical protein
LSFIDEILYKKELKSLYQCSREAGVALFWIFNWCFIQIN